MHPIGVVAERTGLSQDVLRVWERRYGVVDPVRDDAGRRLYSDADIERLRLLALATAAGRGIGQLSRRPTADLAELVRGDEIARRTAPRTAVPDAAATVVEEAMQRTRALDGLGLEGVLRRAAAVHGLPAFLDSVASPLFRRIGEEWHQGRLTPVQEHLASAVARSVLGSQLTSIPLGPDAPSLIVGTPVGERHEIGALLVAAAATADGWRTTYLGPDLAADQIAHAAEVTAARAVAISMVYLPDIEHALAEVAKLRSALTGAVALIAGGSAAAATRDRLAAIGVETPDDLDGFRAILRGFAAQAR